MICDFQTFYTLVQKLVIFKFILFFLSLTNSNKKNLELDSLVFFFFFNEFDYFYYYYFTLQYCIGFAIYQHASALKLFIYIFFKKEHGCLSQGRI